VKANDMVGHVNCKRKKRDVYRVWRGHLVEKDNFEDLGVHRR
jgi:hypothetical protein